MGVIAGLFDPWPLPFPFPLPPDGREGDRHDPRPGPVPDPGLRELGSSDLIDGAAVAPGTEVPVASDGEDRGGAGEPGEAVQGLGGEADGRGSPAPGADGRDSVER